MASVQWELTGGVGRITLDRPEAANAIDVPTARQFAEAVTAAEAGDVRVVLLTGAGKRFCAGGDVRAFLAAEEPSKYVHELATSFELALRRLSELPKPVVAGVQGAVAGAGLGVLLSADVVVAARSTKFRMAYSGVGLTPDCGVSYRLPQAVGLQRALELAVMGRTLTAEEACDWGLVTEVADDDALTARAAELAATLAAGPAAALGQAKRLIRSSLEGTREASAADEADTIAAAVGTSESQQLIEQFIKR